MSVTKFKTEPFAQVSYSVEKDYFDDSKSISVEIKGEDIDMTSDSDNDEDELATFLSYGRQPEVCCFPV